MAELSLTSFGGEIPRLGKERLPDTAASTAANCLLLSGEIRGLHKPVTIHTFGTGPAVNRAFSLEATDVYSRTWIGFNDATTHVLKGPLINDAYDRHYMSSVTDDPRMNTRARIETDDAWYLLGTPAPSGTPTLSSTGGSGSQVTRAYVYTLVSPYGEEGPVSEPIVHTGLDDDTWTFGNLDTTIPDSTERPSPYTKRIYRTVTGVSGTAAYFFVAEVSLATTSYDDSNLTSEVSLNDTCQSFYWQPPPSTLQGFVSHPAGFLIGYDGRDIYFSEPYRPHAFPPGYVLSTDHPIVGIGVFGTAVAVMTEGFPYIIYGNHPANMASMKINTSEPCISRDSIVEMPFGVYYASQNGLQLVTQSGVTNVTQQLITRDEWYNQYNLASLKAARYNDYYIGFYDSNNGFMFAPSEPNAIFTSLRDVWDIDNIQMDTDSGLTITLKDNVVGEWNSPAGEPQIYTWKSKRFVLPTPSNMAAYRIGTYTVEFDSGVAEQRQAYNDQRIVYPLDPIDNKALGTSRKYAIPDAGIYQARSPLGGPILQPVSPSSPSGIPLTLAFSLYSDTELVFTSTVDSDMPLRLPSGFKSTKLEVEVTGNIPVTSIKVASTGKGLMRI